MKRFILSSALFAVFAVMFACVGFAAEKVPVKGKILYYDYTYRFVHTPTIDIDGEPGVCATALRRMVAPLGYELVCTKDGSVFDGDLSSYAAFILYTSGELDHPGGKVGQCLSKKGMRNFFQAVRDGAGLLGIHSATVCPLPKTPVEGDLNPEYVRIIGANLIGHQKPQETDVLVTEPVQLPSLKPLGKNFRHFEEWYCMQNFNKDLHVLLVMQTKGMTGSLYQCDPLPVAWVRMEGKGRVAYHALGHSDEHWSDPKVLNITNDLLQFVLGKLKVDTTPNWNTSKK